ncbi:hypothetical protein [Helicobacter pylori]|uniref:hypothetical protein n=1 Tax=Helicobacter pylori TaxID=210 RepID=UPI001F0C9B3F|nr:hypothetical protein [Helicobacter pylori]
MSSDFKNLFIGANNSKRTKSNLIAKKVLSILIRYHLSLMPAFKEYKEARSKYLSLKSLSILTNPYPPN